MPLLFTPSLSPGLPERQGCEVEGASALRPIDGTPNTKAQRKANTNGVGEEQGGAIRTSITQPTTA